MLFRSIGRRFLQPSLIDGFAKCVVANIELRGDLTSRRTLAEQCLRVREDVGGQHGGAAGLARLKETGDALLVVLRDATSHADRGDAERADDVTLFAGALTDELGGEHPKGRTVVLGMDEHGSHTAEVGPSLILFDNAEAFIDRAGPLRDERQ